MKTTILVSMLFVLLTSEFHLFAAQQEDVRGVNLRKSGNKIIDEKCLTCHNRQRIDSAIKERKSMEGITRLMEKKGAVLSDKDRQVLGHFWQQNPLKKNK